MERTSEKKRDLVGFWMLLLGFQCFFFHGVFFGKLSFEIKLSMYRRIAKKMLLGILASFFRFVQA